MADRGLRREVETPPLGGDKGKGRETPPSGVGEGDRVLGCVGGEAPAQEWGTAKRDPPRVGTRRVIPPHPPKELVGASPL